MSNAEVLNKIDDDNKNREMFTLNKNKKKNLAKKNKVMIIDDLQKFKNLE